MNLLGHLILYIGALALSVVVGTFIFMMIDTILDMIEEHQQARERDKWRN